MSKFLSFRSALLCALVLSGLGTAALADPAGPVVRLAILGTPNGNGGYTTQALSVAVGIGEGFQGVTFGNPAGGSIGAAVGNGGIEIVPPEVGSGYETIICNTSCTQLPPS